MKLPFLSPPSIEHAVGDELYNFYPNRVYIIGKLRGFLKPLFKAISTLSATYDTDIGKESVESKGSDGEYQLRTTLQPIDEGLAKQRFDQRERTIEYLVENLTSPPALRSIGLMVMDSMRDNFDAKPKDNEVDEFVNSVTIDTLVEMLKGVAKASKEVFGPLTDRVEGALSTLKARTAASPEQPNEPPEEQQQETQTTLSGQS